MERTPSYARVWWMSLAVVLGAALSSQAVDGPYSYYTVTPCRLVDTRVAPHGPIMTHLATRAVKVQGASACQVPNGAKAVALNVTAVTPTGLGFLALFPANVATPPNISTINFAANEYAVANGAVVLLADVVAYPNDLKVHAYTSGGQVHFILDVVGYFQ
jgi:hypothetical protein